MNAARTCIGALMGLAFTFAVANDHALAAPSSSEEAPVCEEAGVTVTFAVGSSDLNERARSSLKQVAKWMNGADGRSVRVEGYTDKTGNPKRNQELSEKRAAAARTFLITEGAEPERIDTEAFGEHAARPDVKNTRAVVVVACLSPTPPEPEAAAEPPSPPPEEPQVAEVPPPPEVAPAPAPVVPLPPPQATVQQQQQPRKDLPPSQIGVQATVGGGVTGFISDGARSLVETGGSWEARIAIGTRMPVAMELAYLGSAQGINALGLDSNAVLLGNGGEADLRINFTTMRVQPYIFGGIGWTRYQIENTPVANSSVNALDDVMTVPFGVGLSARLGQGFIFDIRGTARATFYDGMLATTTNTASTDLGSWRMHNWNAGARLGWEF